MSLLLQWFGFSGGVVLAGYVVPGVTVPDVWVAIFAGALLLFIHTLIKPIVKLITLPLSIITLGLFGLLLNGLFFLFVANLIPGLDVVGIMAAIYAALIVSVINWIIKKIVD